jgi:hypothetical protein
MSQVIRWQCGIAIVFTLAAIHVEPVSACGQEPSMTARNSKDCGTLALHMLLMIEGLDTRIETLNESLPSRGPDGYSLVDLRNAARSCGLELMGIRLPHSGVPDRPALVYLERDGHGHFVVVRPVGKSGNLVQVIDSARGTTVIDGIRLANSRTWTGIGLMPVRRNWLARIGWGVLIASLVTGLTCSCVPRFRSWLGRRALREMKTGTRGK